MALITAADAQRATDAAVEAHDQPILKQAIAKIEDAIAEAIAGRKYRVVVDDMVHAHRFNAEIQANLRGRGFDVGYEAVSSRRSCPSGLYRYIIDWSKKETK